MRDFVLTPEKIKEIKELSERRGFQTFEEQFFVEKDGVLEYDIEKHYNYLKEKHDNN